MRSIGTTRSRTTERRGVSPPVLALLACACACHLGCGTADLERVRYFNDDGVYLFERGDYRTAQDSFEAALALQPGDAHLLYNLGQCCHRQNRMSQAETHYRQCLQVSPNHADCRHALVVLLLWDGRRREAEEMIDDWLRREPQRADPYVEDAWRLRQNGQLEQAKGRLQQALALDPRHVRALTELGILYEVERHPDRALVLYERALQVSPERPELVARVNHLRSQGIRSARPN